MNNLPIDRRDTPTYRKRLEVLTNSTMHADAVRICQLARSLRNAVDDFVLEHNPDEAIDLFVAARCNLPSDITGHGIDENRDWSMQIFDDVAGFQWGLKLFLGCLSNNLSVPDDGSEVGDAVDQAGEDVEPAIVCG
jgi:hypothetical protein